MRLRQQSTLRRCEHGDFVDGPHPGCAEFAPPDWMQCGNQALYIVRFKGYDRGWFGGPYTATWRFCQEHAAEYINDFRVQVADGQVINGVIKIIRPSIPMSITEYLDRDIDAKVVFG